MDPFDIFINRAEDSGVIDDLKMFVDGDTIRINDYEFEYKAITYKSTL